ncbi:MAG: hydroxymethylbilane synthase, partial [Bacilli bacterium]
DQLDNVKIIGTSSLRRSLQIQHYLQKAEVKWIRGNIDTRIKKLESGEYDAIILAAAGIHRLGIQNDLTLVYLDTLQMVSAVGQGALALECRADDEITKTQLAHIHCEQSAEEVLAERTFLRLMNGGCEVPIGASCVRVGEVLHITGMVGDESTQKMEIYEVRGKDAEEIGTILAKQVQQQSTILWAQRKDER